MLAVSRRGIHPHNVEQRQPGSPPDRDYARRADISDDEIMRRLRDHALIVVNGALDPSAFPGQPLLIPGDGHPTAVANRVRALLVRDAVQSLFPEAPSRTAGTPRP